MHIETIAETSRRAVCGDHTATDPVGGDPEQRKADDQDDGAGDQRREEPHQLGEERRQDHHEDAGGDDRSVDGADAVLRADGDHRCDGGESAALHQGEAHAEPFEPDRLDQSGDTRHEQIGGDQVAQVVRVQFSGPDQRTADNERNGNRPGVKGKHVLQAQRTQLFPGW